MCSSDLSLAEAPCVLLKRSLNEVGIGVTPDNMEVDFVIYTNPDLPQALDSGAVDAIALVDPIATVGMNQYGFKMILDQATNERYKDEYCCVTFVTKELAEKYPETAAAFTRAVMKASAWVQANPDETAAFLVEKEYLSGKPEVLGKILSSYVFTPSVQGGYNALANNVREFIEIGLLDASTDADAFIKDNFVFLDGVEETYSAKADPDKGTDIITVSDIVDSGLDDCCR